MVVAWVKVFLTARRRRSYCQTFRIAVSGRCRFRKLPSPRQLTQQGFLPGNVCRERYVFSIVIRRTLSLCGGDTCSVLVHYWNECCCACCMRDSIICKQYSFHLAECLKPASPPPLVARYYTTFGIGPCFCPWTTPRKMETNEKITGSL